jgi:alpha/beta superfamily hydrolase
MVGKEYKVKIPASSGVLEGQISLNENEHRIGILMCHPHPQLGGNMATNVIRFTYKFYHQKGWPVLRFNFRGVGESDGKYDNGIGEQEDIKAAMQFLLKEGPNPPKKIILIGYSFGAAIGAGIVEQTPEIIAYIGISHPMTYLANFTPLLKFSKPKFLIMGDQDEFTKLDTFHEIYHQLPEPKDFYLFQGVDHFWSQAEDGLVKKIDEWITEFLKKSNE